MPNNNSLIKTITTKIKMLPQSYQQKIHPLVESTLNTIVAQPFKSLVRFHHLKKAYNPKYSLFISFSKTFIATYFVLNFFQFDLATSSLVGKPLAQTEYSVLVRKACEDSAGLDMISHQAVEMINKGKKSGLLAIELNELAYLLQPHEIAWQGRYLASLKS